MIESIRRKPVSKPKPYKDIRGKYKWVVYFYDVQKDVRAKKLFVDKLSADAFYEEKSFVENRLGVEANNISIADRRDLLEAKRLLEPFDLPFIDAIRHYVNLSNEAISLKTTLRQIVDEYKKTENAKKSSVSLRRAVEAYANSKQGNGLTKIYSYKIANLLERFCETFGDNTIVSSISCEQIETWINSMKKRVYADSPDEMLNGGAMKVYVDTDIPVSSITKNGFRSILFTFFKFCRMRGWINENPVERIPAIREKLKTPKFYKVEEVANMLSKTEPLSDVRAYLAIAAFAGLRRREIERLTWDKIKLPDREIVMDNEVTKTGARRIVKISENLAMWLAPYSDRLNTKNHIVEQNFVKRLNAFRIANGIKWINNGLRHSAATYYLALTRNAAITAEQMGHAVDVLKQHYNGLAREKEAKAYFDIKPSAL